MKKLLMSALMLGAFGLSFAGNPIKDGEPEKKEDTQIEKPHRLIVGYGGATMTGPLSGHCNDLNMMCYEYDTETKHGTIYTTNGGTIEFKQTKSYSIDGKDFKFVGELER